MAEQHEDGPPSYEEATRDPQSSAESECTPEQLGASSAPVESTSNEEKKREAEKEREAEKKREAEYGWRDTVDPGCPSTSGIDTTSVPIVLPPGLQPLLTLDTLLIRETYERGKGRRYRVCNKNGEAVLYARKTRRGPKDYQLYDSTRTAIVGLWNFSVASDSSLYANLECPPKIPLATIRAEESSSVPGTNSGNASKHTVKYTICNVLGQAIFTASSPTIMDDQDTNIKVYSALAPGTVVADFMWNIEHPETGDDTRTIIERNNEGSFEKWVKVTFPLDLEVKMKAALLATCFLKDKIDHRMTTKGGNNFSDSFGSSSRHRPRRKHYMHF